MIALSAIFALVIALSAIVSVTSFNVEFAPPVTSISLDIILPSPIISVGSTVIVYSVLFPVTKGVTSIPVPSTTVVVSSLDVIIPSNSSNAACTSVLVKLPAGVTSTSDAF